MRVLLYAAMTSVCALAASVAGDVLSAQQQPAFRDSSDLVRVFATVIDRDGRLATTLTREQFEVRDEGKPQPLTQFDNSPQPIRLVVMLDVSGSMEGNLPLLRDASAQLFRRLRPDDVARVGAFGNQIVISPTFTNDARALVEALPRHIDPDAPTPLWRAVNQAIDAFDPGDDRRKVVLVLSDGKDSGPISFRERPVSQAEIIDRARDQDVMIYGVAMRSRSRQPVPPGIGPGGLQAMVMADLPDPGLARAAEESGGGFLEIRYGQDLSSAFTSVADELHTQYLLGFEPPKRDGKVHDINVRVSASGHKARARRSYLAPKS
jgi:Ca-activated chloride channel homolog